MSKDRNAVMIQEALADAGIPGVKYTTALNAWRASVRREGESRESHVIRVSEELELRLRK